MEEAENIMLRERNQSQESTYYRMLFIWNAQNRRIYRDRKSLSWSGWGDLRLTGQGYGVSFWGDEYILELLMVAQLREYTNTA